jgi:hypothetical protein
LLSSIVRVRATRLDAHRQLAHCVVGDDQGFWVQDLAVSGLARTPLAESVHVAGWSALAGCCRRRRWVAAGGGGGQWLVRVEPAVFGVWVQLRQEAPGCQVLGLAAVWSHP